MHLAALVKTAVGDGHQPAGTFQPRPAALGTVVFDHHFLQVFVHSRVRRPLFAIPAIVVFELADDAIEFDFLPSVLVPLFRSRRQGDFEQFAFRAMKENVDDLRREFLKRCVETESIMNRKTVQDPTAPTVRT